jgi:hypothetical protein
VSNVNRAVTRTRRAVTSRKGTRIGAVPWPGPAVYRDPPAGEQQPPFTVTRRAPKSRAPQGRPMDQYARWVGYAAQGCGGEDSLTATQNRRWAKKFHQQVKRAAPPKTPVSKPGQKPGTGEGQGKGGRTDPGGPVQPPNPKGKP